MNGPGCNYAFKPQCSDYISINFQATKDQWWGRGGRGFNVWQPHIFYNFLLLKIFFASWKHRCLPNQEQNSTKLIYNSPLRPQDCGETELKRRLSEEACVATLSDNPNVLSWNKACQNHNHTGLLLQSLQSSNKEVDNVFVERWHMYLQLQRFALWGHCGTSQTRALHGL